MPLVFEPIEIEYQDKYLERLAACPVKTSDYSFINLWGWAREYGLEWAWTDKMVWIRQTLPEVLYWPPVAAWGDISDWPEFMEKLDGETLRFVRIPGLLLNIWKEAFKDRLFSEEDRGQWDYLYRADDLSELKGNRFHKKKNLLNQFLKKYDYRFTGFGKEMIEKVLGMQSEWCDWRDCELNDALAAENRAIEKVLKTWNRLKGLCGGAIAVDEKIVAYTIGESLSRDTLLIHFEKGNPEYQGTYQAVNQMFVQRALKDCEQPFEMVNRMQDLGDEGLRKAKMSYNPADFIRKHKVEIHSG